MGAASGFSAWLGWRLIAATPSKRRLLAFIVYTVAPAPIAATWGIAFFA